MWNIILMELETSNEKHVVKKDALEGFNQLLYI